MRRQVANRTGRRALWYRRPRYALFGRSDSRKEPQGEARAAGELSGAVASCEHPVGADFARQTEQQMTETAA